MGTVAAKTVYTGSGGNVYRIYSVCVCVRVRWWPCAAAGGADLATRRVEEDADAGV